VVPLQQVSDVVCCGDVSWSGAALRTLASRGISVACLDGIGRWVGRWEPAESRAVLLRRAQFRAADDEVKCAAIASAIVQGKIRNSRILLMRAQRDGMVEAADEIAALGDLMYRTAGVADVDSARGMEGAAARTYFGAYGRLISVNGFSFSGRNRRPPGDPVNAMLSFGYVLLTRTAAAAGRIVGFDTHVGFLHRDRYGRESLALDLVEEFRPVVIDALVAALVHKRVMDPDDFIWKPTECRMTDAGRKRFIEHLERKLASEVTHPVLQQRVSLRRAVELQARLLAKYLTGEVDGYISFSKR
jgi:CRISPR-associated protein Cas1